MQPIMPRTRAPHNPHSTINTGTGPVAHRILSLKNASEAESKRSLDVHVPHRKKDGMRKRKKREKARRNQPHQPTPSRGANVANAVQGRVLQSCSNHDPTYRCCTPYTTRAPDTRPNAQAAGLQPARLHASAASSCHAYETPTMRRPDG